MLNLGGYSLSDHLHRRFSSAQLEIHRPKAFRGSARGVLHFTLPVPMRPAASGNLTHMFEGLRSPPGSNPVKAPRTMFCDRDSCARAHEAAKACAATVSVRVRSRPSMGFLAESDGL